MSCSSTNMLALEGVYGTEIEPLKQELRVEKYRATASRKADAHVTNALPKNLANPKQRTISKVLDIHRVTQNLLLALAAGLMLLSLPAMKHGRLESLEHMFHNLPEHIFRGLPIDILRWEQEVIRSAANATEMVELYQQQINDLQAARDSLHAQAPDMAEVKEQAKKVLKEAKEQFKAHTENCQALEDQSKILHEALRRLEKLVALAKGLDQGWADYDKVMAQANKLEEALSSMEKEPATTEEMDNFRADWENNSIEKTEIMMRVMKVKSAWEEEMQVTKETCALQLNTGRNEQVNEVRNGELDEIKMWEAWYGPPNI